MLSSIEYVSANFLDGLNYHQTPTTFLFSLVTDCECVVHITTTSILLYARTRVMELPDDTA